MAAQLVLQDRTAVTKWAVQIQDGQLAMTPTSDPAEPEPIVEDDTVPGTYWQWFVDDGQIGIEGTATVQDDLVDLEDTVTAQHNKLVVEDGQLGWQPFTPAGADVFFDWRRRGMELGVLIGMR